MPSALFTRFYPPIPIGVEEDIYEEEIKNPWLFELTPLSWIGCPTFVGQFI